MKKAILLLVLAFFLCSCANNNPAGRNDSPANKTIASDGYLHIDLPQLNKESQRIYYVEWGKLTSESGEEAVYLVSDKQSDDSVQTEVYLAAMIDGQTITRSVGTFEKMVIQNGSMFLADLDGDAVDEIILNLEVNGNGATMTGIYQVKNREIVSFADLTDFDTGYTGHFLNDRKMQIANTSAAFSTVIDLSAVFNENFFDDNGVATTKESIHSMPFTLCGVEDIDSDGVYELCCEQFIRLVSVTIGKASSVLKYDMQTKLFKTVSARFESDNE